MMAPHLEKRISALVNINLTTKLPAGHDGAHESREAVTGIVGGKAGDERFELGGPGRGLESRQAGLAGGEVV